MSPKIPSLAAGLTALGLSLSAPFCVAQVPSDPATTAPPASERPAAAPTPAPTVLLLSNGDVLQGEISEDDDGYLVKLRLGTIRRKRRDVEGTFAGFREVYAYKAGRVPRGDPDEHLRLARWCLGVKLDAEALTELKAAVALDPNNKQAKGMLYNVQTAAARKPGEIDPGVLPASLTRTIPPAGPGGSPGVLNLANVRQEARRVDRTAPIIFDLPTPVAIRRYQEFARFVHPQLRASCASCHNESSTGRFQLIPVATKQDGMNDALLKANLDATLRLVDPSNLNASALLQAALMDHPPTDRPILRGPNDPAYRDLWTWVNSLRTGDPASRSTIASALPPGAASNEGFAAGRGMVPGPLASGAGAPAPMPGPPTVPGVLRPSGLVPGSQAGPAMTPGAEPDFRTVSPLTDPGQAPAASPKPISTATTTPAMAMRIGPKGERYYVGPDGKPVPVGPDGQPLVDGSKVAPSKDRKPRDFNLDPSSLGQVLSKPR